MKSMKGRFEKTLGNLRKKSSDGDASGAQSSAPSERPPPLGSTAGKTPEITARDSVRAFCESGGSVKSDEVLFLPPIVDAAESSPAAAAECARNIRKYLSKDYYHSRPSWQYNAVMLIRILTDNPGEYFTRAIDQKFVDAVQALLRTTKDPSVRQILMETLDDFENTKMDDANLNLIITMWKNEKDDAIKKFGGGQMPRGQQAYRTQMQAMSAHQQNYFSRHHENRQLPPPAELAGRLEEARTSAKLLEQVVMNTAPGEMLGNELIKEFADRCLSASRSIQGYMTSQNPAPDNDTMESLIDTNEQLQTALNQHQRARLSAKKSLGLEDSADSTAASPEMNGGLLPRRDTTESLNNGALLPPAEPATAAAAAAAAAPAGNGKGKATESYEAPPGPPPAAATYDSGVGGGSSAPQQRDTWEDPFADPSERHPQEPLHPGGSNHAQNGRRNQNEDDEDDLYDAPRDKGPAR